MTENTKLNNGKADEIDCCVLLSCRTCKTDFGYVNEDITLDYEFQCIECAEKKNE